MVVEEVGHVQVCVRVLCPDQTVLRDVFVQLTTYGNTASESSSRFCTQKFPVVHIASVHNNSEPSITFTHSFACIQVCSLSMLKASMIMLWDCSVFHHLHHRLSAIHLSCYYYLHLVCLGCIPAAILAVPKSRSLAVLYNSILTPLEWNFLWNTLLRMKKSCA